MDLTGTPLLVLAAAGVVAFPVALLLLWSRVRGAPPLRALQRLGLVLGCQLSALALAGFVVNDQFSFYDSWSDLLGVQQSVVAGGPRPDPLEGATWTSASAAHPFGT